VPEVPPTEEGARTEAAGDAPTREEPARRTRDQSTVGLASSIQPTGAPARAEGEFAALDIGETLAGRFTVLRFIARGGMGAVYEASDVLLRTRVALKVIGGHLATDATATERFRREVLLARRVGHPNVCRVYELYEARTGRGASIHFLTMELLEGESLARRLARTGRMRTEEALPLVKQMCDGLAAAHAEGVIHRDFKSSNVLLVPRAVEGEGTTSSTRVVITDFGVARALGLASKVESEEGPLTGRSILGTPEYMAPEQVTGAEVTAAADIYALGVVLYEMVTGKLPFAAHTPLAAAARRLNEAPPRPETTVPGLDKRWAAAIVRCLSRQPEQRFRSARDVIPALDRPRRTRRLTAPLAVTGAVLLLIGAYGAVKYRPSLRLRGPEKKAVLAAPRQKVAFLGVRNEFRSERLKWLPTAVTELLTHELAAAESSLRVLPPDWMEGEHRSLGVTADDVGDEKAQKRLQAIFDEDVFVYGVLSLVEPGPEGVRLRVRALEAGSRKELGSFEEDLGPDGARLIEALPGAAESIRSLLGVSLSPEEEAALSASRAHNLDAAKVYAEGVILRQRWDLEEARSRFEAAIAADASFVQAKRELARTWEDQGNPKRAQEVWKSVRETPGALSTRQAASVDLHIAPDRDKLSALFEAAPDDLEVGLDLAARLPLRARPQLIKRLQQLRAVPPLVLELREARAADEMGAPQRAAELLDHVATRATELGARWELARARMFQASRVPTGDPARRKEALDRFAEAERLYTEVGELDNLADTKRRKAEWFANSGSRREALAALDDAAGYWRRLGNRPWLAHNLLVTALYLRDYGELAASRKKLEEARSELEILEEAPPFMRVLSYLIRAWQAFDAANLDAAQEELRRARKVPGMAGFGKWLELLEACMLDEEDHREEARAAYSKGLPDAVEKVAGMCTVDCDGDSPVAGLACLAQKCRTDDPEFVGIRKASCTLEQARCSVRANDFPRAEREAREAAALLESVDLYELALKTRAVLMRVAAARGDSARSIRTLRADLVKVESQKNIRLAFETALALGEVELRAGRPEGRARLARLEKEAKSREFFRIARLAREALDQKAVASARPKR